MKLLMRDEAKRKEHTIFVTIFAALMVMLAIVVMLIPSIGSICILQLLERFNIRYTRISQADLRKNPLRDTGWGVSSTVISVAILSIFAVIFVVPLVQNWPYQTQFTLAHVQAVFADSELQTVYLHSLGMALCTAFFGTLLACSLPSWALWRPTAPPSSPPGAPCPRGTSGSSRALPW